MTMKSQSAIVFPFLNNRAKEVGKPMSNNANPQERTIVTACKISWPFLFFFVATLLYAWGTSTPAH